jgi:hypothetical protein
MELETKVAEMETKGFVSSIKKGLRDTGKLYLEVAKRPYLLAIGSYNVVKDILYELPKSMLAKDSSESLEARLNKKASQALALSEILTVPGTYAGLALFKRLGADDYTASVIGGAAGNYAAGALSYIAAYAAMTFNKKGYSLKNSLKDALNVVKDCLPTAIALYVSEAPVVSGLIALGLGSNLAVGLNLALGMAIFTGVAKYSAAKIAAAKDSK